MIATGGIYKGRAKTRRHLGVYNYRDDVYAKLPPELSDATRVAHFSYRRGGRLAGLIFLD